MPLGFDPPHPYGTKAWTGFSGFLWDQMLTALDIVVRFPRRRAHGGGQKCPRSMRPFGRRRTEMSALHAAVRTEADRNVRAPCGRSHGGGQECPRSMRPFGRRRTKMSALLFGSRASAGTEADKNVGQISHVRLRSTAKPKPPPCPIPDSACAQQGRQDALKCLRQLKAGLRSSRTRRWWYCPDTPLNGVPSLTNGPGGVSFERMEARKARKGTCYEKVSSVP